MQLIIYATFKIQIIYYPILKVLKIVHVYANVDHGGIKLRKVVDNIILKGEGNAQMHFSSLSLCNFLLLQNILTIDDKRFQV